jgi:hypothetical protein
MDRPVRTAGHQGVVVEPLALDASFVVTTEITPPAATSMNLTAVSFEARRHDEDTALAACFTAPLDHGFSRDEVAPLALDALRDLGLRKLGLRDVTNGSLVDVSHGIRRVDSARAANGAPAVLASDLGFTSGGDLVACVSGCTNDAACGQAIRAPRLAGDLAEAPPPGLALSLALAVVHHPEATVVSGVGAALVLSALAVQFRRRPPRSRHFFV